MKLASLRDTDLLIAAREEAAGVLLRDPVLELPEHQLLAKAVERLVRIVDREEPEVVPKPASSRRN